MGELQLALTKRWHIYLSLVWGSLVSLFAKGWSRLRPRWRKLLWVLRIDNSYQGKAFSEVSQGWQNQCDFGEVWLLGSYWRPPPRPHHVITVPLGFREPGWRWDGEAMCWRCSFRSFSLQVPSSMKKWPCFLALSFRVALLSPSVHF